MFRLAKISLLVLAPIAGTRSRYFSTLSKWKMTLFVQGSLKLKVRGFLHTGGGVKLLGYCQLLTPKDTYPVAARRTDSHTPPEPPGAFSSMCLSYAVPETSEFIPRQPRVENTSTQWPSHLQGGECQWSDQLSGGSS